jgi:rubrerythrin
VSEQQYKEPTPTATHHKWVKHTITNVSAIPDLDEPEKVSIFEDPIDTAQGEAGAVYGCDVCGCPMEGNTDTLCPGAASE